MEIEYASSKRSTIGLEWEVACVDRASGELTPAAPDVFPRLKDGGDTLPQATRELLTNTVELVSAPHARVRDAVTDLEDLLAKTRSVTDDLGIDLMCAGTHPYSQWYQQEITPGNERYAELIDRTQWWGRQLMIWGVHMHVGIEDREKVMPILNGLLTYYPHFQALSASSPYWAGEDTGYASNRAMMFQQLPTAGLPPQLGGWGNFEQVVGDLVHVGIIDGFGDLRWDVRPAPKWGTVELRFCDGLPTLAEVAALGALAQCLVEELSTRLDDDDPIDQLQPWFVRENKWRAARYGMDAIVIENSAGDERPVRDDLLEVLERLAPIADRLGCAGELGGIRSIMDAGASYQRQRSVAEASDGNLRAVVGSLVDELRNGIGG